MTELLLTTINEAQKQLTMFAQLAQLENLQQTDEVHKLLSDLYGKIWIQAFYDPDTAEVQIFARKLLPLIRRLNEILHFKA